MKNKHGVAPADGVYYVRGSELIPIPYHSLTDIRRLRREHHESEVRHVILLAYARKPA